MKYKLDEKFALELDQNDKLKEFKNRFYLKEDRLYFDGNSLGLMSVDAEESLNRVIDEWKELGIDGWLDAQTPWFYFAEKLGEMQSEFVGAEKEEVIIHSSTTINQHLLLGSLYKPTEKRYKILVDDINFPTDRYAVESFIKTLGKDVEDTLVVYESNDGKTIDEKDVVKMMNEEIALVLLPGVLYRSGQLLDMEYLTKEAHKRDIIIGFDCSHSVGAVPHYFDKWGTDFAFWCNYKYMNNGPGGTASIYLNKRHFDKEPGFAGWFGFRKDKQFDLSNEFISSNNAGMLQVGTPHILSMAPLEGSLKLYKEAGKDNLREKSLELTNYMIYLIDNKLSKYGFEVGTPREDNRRGGHIALEHDEAARINKAMKARGIIPDFRKPNVIRLAPVALYISFHDVWKLINIIEDIMKNKDYEKFSNERGVVA